MVAKNSKDYCPKVIFCYSIEHLEKKDKVRFYYALKGRDGKNGIIKEYNVEQLGRAVLMVPFKFVDEIAEFLRMWKCDFEKREVLVKK